MPYWKRCSSVDRVRTFRSDNNEFKQTAAAPEELGSLFHDDSSRLALLSEDSTVGMLIRYGAGALNLGSSSAAFWNSFPASFLSPLRSKATPS
jgi:hypothetical protein